MDNERRPFTIGDILFPKKPATTATATTPRRPPPRICTLQGCKAKKTPYKRSAFCASHTCDNIFCGTPSERGDKYCSPKGAAAHPRCDHHKCMSSTGCGKERSVFPAPASTFCADHACYRCRVRQATLGTGSFRFCTECRPRCRVPFCDTIIGEDVRFCATHACSAPGCHEQRVHVRDFCSGHLCHGCFGLRTGDHQGWYCGACLGKCLGTRCTRLRPVTHADPLYYCDDHGCLDCHAVPRHRYEHNRVPTVSDRCQRHTPPVFSRKTPEEWRADMESMSEAIADLNSQVNNRRDSEEYNLTCPRYCSEGYCHCDMMPRINVSHVSAYGLPDQATNLQGERVFLLSQRAPAEKGYYAWTIPVTATDNGSLIRFELVWK